MTHCLHGLSPAKARIPFCSKVNIRLFNGVISIRLVLFYWISSMSFSLSMKIRKKYLFCKKFVFRFIAYSLTSKYSCPCGNSFTSKNRALIVFSLIIFSIVRSNAICGKKRIAIKQAKVVKCEISMTFFTISIEFNKKTVLDLLLWWISLTFLWLFCAALSPVLWDAPNKIRYFLPYHLPVSKYNLKKDIIGDLPRRKYTIFLYWNDFLNWFIYSQQCCLISIYLNVTFLTVKIRHGILKEQYVYI